MHTRFAALLLALGLADVGYLNLALAPEVFLRDAAARTELSSTDRVPADLASADLASADLASADPASTEPRTTRAALRESEPRRHARPLEDSRPVAGTAPPAAPDEISPPPGPAGVPEPARALIVSFPQTATATLTPEARDELRLLADRLREHPEQQLRVVGHADARGTNGFNRYLGARRARAVAEVLLAAGVQRTQIQALSRGEDEPRIAGESEAAWAANRRVEISISEERSNLQ